MPITDNQLDQVVRAWYEHVVTIPQNIKPRELLKNRDISTYRGLGINTLADFSRALVEHRTVASLEMGHGYLFERVLEELGPTKLSRKDKKLPGNRGIDFTHPTPGQLFVISMKASPSTFNGDITRATVANLAAAKKCRENQSDADDNPLAQRPRKVVMVRAVARGASKKTITPEGILWLVGDALWQNFGAGPNLLQRLNEALGRNPLDQDRYEAAKGEAAKRVATYLQQHGFADSAGNLDWMGLIKAFP